MAVANLDDNSAIQLPCRSIVTAAGHSAPHLDNVRDRFEPTAVSRAVLLGRDRGLTVPLLLD